MKISRGNVILQIGKTFWRIIDLFTYTAAILN